MITTVAGDSHEVCRGAASMALRMAELYRYAKETAPFACEATKCLS